MGILYETEKYLHNWALSFALFETLYIPKTYRLQGANAQKPTYLEPNQEHSLLYLNNAEIYVFPALPITWSYQINTFKAAQVPYYGKSAQFGGEGARKNYPVNYGRAKELAIGSQFKTYIFAANSITIPRWIRLGKWSAKVKVEAKAITEFKQRSGEYMTKHPLNPVDLSPSTRLLLYNRVVMPPSSLVSQAQLSGDYYELQLSDQDHQNKSQNKSDRICLPAGVIYGANMTSKSSQITSS
jgi:CRISPR-associated protein Csc1